MDPKTIERLRQIIACIERRSRTAVTRPDEEDTGPGRWAGLEREDGRHSPGLPSEALYPPCPSPTSVTAPAAGVKLLTYHLSPGDYPSLGDCSADDVLNLFRDVGLLPGVADCASSRDLGAPAPPVFLDLETTALGGAGTLPFLAGVGYWCEGKFVVKQFLLEERSAEVSLLENLAPELRSSLLVTFNGKCFDIPVLRDRFILSGAGPFPAPGAHLDLYSVARRLGRKPGYTWSLGQCEARYLGFRRTGDISSRAVPALYFMYERERDESILKPVLRHNLMDVVAMASLAGVFCDIMQAGTRSSSDPEALLGAARIHAASKRYDRAKACLEAALAYPYSSLGSTPEFRHLLADVLWKLGERRRAAGLMEDLMREGFLDKYRYARLSAYYERSGDLQKALAVLEYALGKLTRQTKDGKLTESLRRKALRLRKRLYGMPLRCVPPE
ncbi:MAG: ribonuclease H-like domain-containing protein [Firmicutes bacterium]|nr:ribonuclease H-like domain-containing protein [Candidatus Fermentithermobacillaceae bacterium]